jgi:hypothetical protein
MFRCLRNQYSQDGALGWTQQFIMQIIFKILRKLFCFTDTTTKAITHYKDVMQRQELQNNLVFIKANYNFMSKTIEHLEKQQLLLTESIKIIEKFKERILSVPGKIGEIVKKKKQRKHFQKTKIFLNCRTSVKS